MRQSSAIVDRSLHLRNRLVLQPPTPRRKFTPPSCTVLQELELVRRPSAGADPFRSQLLSGPLPCWNAWPDAVGLQALRAAHRWLQPENLWHHTRHTHSCIAQSGVALLIQFRHICNPVMSCRLRWQSAAMLIITDQLGSLHSSHVPTLPPSPLSPTSQ